MFSVLPVSFFSPKTITSALLVELKHCSVFLCIDSVIESAAERLGELGCGGGSQFGTAEEGCASSIIGLEPCHFGLFVMYGGRPVGAVSVQCVFCGRDFLYTPYAI